MERLLTCNCGNKVAVSRAQAGQQVQCSQCGTNLQVPTLRGLNELPLAAEATSDSVSAVSRDANWGWRGPVTAMCFAGLLVCGLYSAYQFWIWWQIDTSYTAEMHIAHDLEGFDLASPDALLEWWDTYSQTTLGLKSPPPYKLYADFSADCFRHGSIAAGVAIALALVSVGTIFSARSGKS